MGNVEIKNRIVMCPMGGTSLFGWFERTGCKLDKEAAKLFDDDAFTCACYPDQVGNKPEKGEILSWVESSAVVYANSVLGARCNRNSGIMDIMGSIAGFVPYFGLLTNEGRKVTWW